MTQLFMSLTAVDCCTFMVISFAFIVVNVKLRSSLQKRLFNKAKRAKFLLEFWFVNSILCVEMNYSTISRHKLEILYGKYSLLVYGDIHQSNSIFFNVAERAYGRPLSFWY